MQTESAQFRRASLRWLMVLIVLLAALPIFALHVMRLQASSEAAVQRAYQDAAALAASGAAAHDQTTTQARQLLEVLSRIPAVRTAAQPECEDILQSVHLARAWLTGILVTGPDGKGTCGSSPVVRALDIGGSDNFQAVKTTGESRISGVFVSRVTGEEVVSALMPLLDARGRFLAALVAGVRLSWIEELAAEANAKSGGSLIAFDKAGRVIAYRPSTGHDPNMNFDRLSENPQVRRIFAAADPTFEAEGPDGVQRLFGAVRLSQSGITVAVGLNRAEVLVPITRSFRIDLLLILLVTAGSIGLAWLVAELGLMRGVRRLKSAARLLKAGKMGLRVSLPASVAAELHDLAATYNAMTAEFERLAYLDRLTGLPNRRYLERHFYPRSQDGEPARRGRQAVLAIDIDGFKPVNDCYGHAVGDRVLAIIARRIAATIDERGMLFRVGGDEFVAVVPLGKSQGRAEARALGEEIRLAMEQAIEIDGLTFPVACSVGIALVPDDAKALSGALVVADAALYEAKRAGRNRVVDKAPPLAAELPAAGRERARHRPPLGLGAPW